MEGQSTTNEERKEGEIAQIICRLTRLPQLSSIFVGNSIGMSLNVPSGNWGNPMESESGLLYF